MRRSIATARLRATVVVASAVVGLVLARRVGGNPIGWLLPAFAGLVLGNCAGDCGRERQGEASRPVRRPRRELDAVS